jgi:hypothetical protein
VSVALVTPGDDNRAWESHTVVDVTGQEAVSRMALAADMEVERDPVVVLAAEDCWNSEGFVLQDSGAVMWCWG